LEAGGDVRSGVEQEGRGGDGGEGRGGEGFSSHNVFVVGVVTDPGGSLTEQHIFLRFQNIFVLNPQHCGINGRDIPLFRHPLSTQ
jgi:hypothetical protein